MKILLHVCCAPCSIMSIKKLRELNHDVTGFWYNPNIHPYMEYRSRRDAFRNYSKLIDLPSIYKDEYGLDDFCREVINNLDNRCKSCYAKRICVVAKYAKEHGYDAFCTSLLYSPYQDHEALKEVCYEIAKAFDIEFFYYDFRPYYREGQAEAKRLGIYMQKYCGCIFSEEDRYKKRIEREKIKEEIDTEWEKYKKENQIEDLKKEF